MYKAAANDPKPIELPLGRMSFVEIQGEVRTRKPFNTLG